MIKRFLMPFLIAFGFHTLLAQSIYPAKQGEQYGYIDSSKNWVIQPRFDQAGFYENKKAMAMSGDSLFLVSNVDHVIYLPGLRNFKMMNDSTFAIQNEYGKWALADHEFNALTAFEYQSIAPMASFYLATKNQMKGVINLQNKVLLPFQYEQVRKLSNGQFLGLRLNEMQIIDLVDSARVVLKNKKIEYDSLHPSSYLVRNRAHKTITYYSMKGDSIYSCRSCGLELSYGEFVFIKMKGKLLQFNLKSNTLVDTLSENSPYWTAPASFLYLKERGSVYAVNSGQPVYISSDSLGYAQEQYFYVFSDTGMGLVDVYSQLKLDPIYDYVYFHEKNYVIAHRKDKNYLIHLPDWKIVLRFSNFSYIGISDGSILISKGKGGTLYALNESFEMIDSINFKNIAAIRAGNKNVNNNNFNGFGINNSLSNSWFSYKGRFGLRNEAGDTLLKPFVFSVRFINDSLDLISYLIGKSSLLQIKGYGSVYTNQTYGIINNKTGVYLLRPSTFYIDYNQLIDSSFKVVRVVLRNGYFALLSKEDFKPDKSTYAHYISPSKEGYMRAFYKPVFSVRQNDESRREKYKMYYLNSFLDLCEFGQAETRFSPFRAIYVSSESMHAFDKNGNKLWSDESAHLINHLENAEYGKFICMNKLGNYGVIDSVGRIIIPLKYAKITRLEADNHFFVLSINNLKYGYLNTLGKELTEASYSFAQPYQDGFAWVKLRDSLVLLDEAGHSVETGLQGGRVGGISEGYTSLKLKKGWIVLDIAGNQIGNSHYRQLNMFKNGAASARNKAGWGMIDTEGKWIVNPRFSNCVSENSETVVFSLNNKLYFFNRKGQELSKMKEKGSFKTLGNYYFRQDMGSASKVYNADGEMFTKRRYRQDLRCLQDTVISIAKNRVNLWNSEGKKISSLKHYGGARYYDKGMLKMEKFKSHLFETLIINESNKYFYPDLFPDSIERIRLKKPAIQNYTFSLVNSRLPECMRNNALVFNMKSSLSHPSFCLSDTLGNLLIDDYFLKLKYIGEGLYLAGKMNENDQYVTGLLNALGVWVLEPKFYNVSDFENGKAIYTKMSDFWIADENGQLICQTPIVNYLLKDEYYCLQTEDQVAWWHPGKGWLIHFQ